MSQLFDSNHNPQKYKEVDYILNHEKAEFHPVFLSSLLNQTVFLGDVQQQKYKFDMKRNEKNRDKNEENAQGAQKDQDQILEQTDDQKKEEK